MTPDLRLLTAGLSCLVLLAACSGPRPLEADLVFVHANVVDVETGEIHPDQSIFVQGNRIVGVAPSGQAGVHAESRVIDADGRYAIPGLWDAHVHSAGGVDWHFPLLVAHGVTSVRNMHTTVDSALNLTLDIKRRVASGELTGPRFLANGPIIDGYPPVWPGSVVVRNAAQGRAAVDSLAAAGADFIKVYDNLRPDAYAGIMEAARARGIPVDGHVPFLVGPLAAAAAGQRTVEHTTGINMGCSPLADSLRTEFTELLERLPSMEYPENTVAYFTLVRAATDTRDVELCAEVVRAYREAGVVVVPTLVMEDIDAAAVVADTTLMAMLPAGVQQWWTGMASGGPGPIETVFAGSDWTAPLNTRLLHEAGVRVLAGTDIGNPFLVPGASLHDELALLVDEAGFSPLDALRAATIAPARTFAMQDSLGAIAVGQLADLVLLDRNPLDDIRATTSIHGVLLDGAYLDRGALDALLVPDGSR